MTTVFTVDGFGFKGFLPGLAIVKSYAKAGSKIVPFDYDNMNPTTTNIQSTALGLGDAAATVKDNVVFVGVSMGSQVLCALLRGLGTASKVGDWSFILLANPEHVVTGRRKTPQYGGLGIPDGSPYDVTDVAAQYDYWADAPNGLGMANWYANSYVNMWGNAVHSGSYFTLDPVLNFPCVRRGPRGNIRDMWAPMTSKPWGQSFIEMGYDRPVKL